MVYSFKDTEKSILDEAERLFLRNGYERTNLRAICKGAAVTTGAFYGHFAGKEAVFCELVSEAVECIEEFQEEKKAFLSQNFGNMKSTNEIFKEWIEFNWSLLEICWKFKQSFKLLVKCSDGTLYSNYIEKMVEKDTELLSSMLVVLVKEVNLVDKIEIKYLIRAFISGVFDIVFSNESWVQIEKNYSIYSKFFQSGYKGIF